MRETGGENKEMARNGKDKNHMIGSVMSHSLLILERK